MKPILFISRIAKRLGFSRSIAYIADIFFSLFAKSTIKEECIKEDCWKKLSEIWPDEGKSCICSNTIEKFPIYDIQVILPVYNTCNTLEKAINSVINQEGEQRVLLTIINDGSTDDSTSILNSYEGLPDIEIIHQENKGFSGARNAGLSHIKAKYITFLDSDDLFTSDALKNLYNLACLQDADIVQGSYEMINMNESIRKKIVLEKRLSNGKLLGYPWGKLIKATFFQNLQFPEHYWFEDTLISLVIFPISNRTKDITTEI